MLFLVLLFVRAMLKGFLPQFTVKTFSFLYGCKSNKGGLAGKNLVTRSYAKMS